MKKWLFSAGLVLLLMAMGCAPKAPVAPPVTPAPTPVATPAVQAITPEEAAWARVVEAAKKEGRLTLYTFAFVGDAGRAVSKAFEDKYGIKVETVGGVGAVLAERIRSEQTAGKYIADTFDTSPAVILISKDGGRTEPWGFLPVLTEKDVWRVEPKVDPEGHMLTFSSGLLAPHINTKLVKDGEEPRSFKDLLEPRWKGKIIIASPSTVPTLPYLYVWGRRQGVLDDEYFRRLSKQDIKVAPTIRDKEAMLARGEGALAPTNEATIGPLIAEGAPVRAIDMQEGVLRTMSIAIAPVKNALHPNAAKVFVNWLLSTEGQTIFHRAKATMPTRKDAPDFRPGYRFEPVKTYLFDLSQMVEASRIQREGTLSRLMGLEK